MSSTTATLFVPATAAPRPASLSRGLAALKAGVVAWFVAASLGQLVFFVYVVDVYGRAALFGKYADWNRLMHHAWIPGDTFGNLAVALHLLFASAILLLGTLQLVPSLRRRWPAFHRWSGRVYLVAVLAMSAGGLIMLYTRPTGAAQIQKIAMVGNVALMVVFAACALVQAQARRIDAHRRWALRLYVTALGAWFFRVGLMFWVTANQGPAGFDPKTFQGPFIVFLTFAQYLLPLAILELYLRARDGGGTLLRGVAAGTLYLATAVTAIGVGVATLALWLPHL